MGLRQLILAAWANVVTKKILWFCAGFSIEIRVYIRASEPRGFLVRFLHYWGSCFTGPLFEFAASCRACSSRVGSEVIPAKSEIPNTVENIVNNKHNK